MTITCMEKVLSKFSIVSTIILLILIRETLSLRCTHKHQNMIVITSIVDSQSEV